MTLVSLNIKFCCVNNFRKCFLMVLVDILNYPISIYPPHLISDSELFKSPSSDLLSP